MSVDAARKAQNDPPFTDLPTAAKPRIQFRQQPLCFVATSAMFLLIGEPLSCTAVEPQKLSHGSISTPPTPLMPPVRNNVPRRSRPERLSGSGGVHENAPANQHRVSCVTVAKEKHQQPSLSLLISLWPSHSLAHMAATSPSSHPFLRPDPMPLVPIPLGHSPTAWLDPLSCTLPQTQVAWRREALGPKNVVTLGF